MKLPFINRLAAGLLLLAGLLLALPLQAGILALTATGYGSDEESARAAALRELSTMVAADIDSEQVVRSHYSTDAGSEESMDSRIAVRAEGYFQGVDYGDPELHHGEYAVEARLTQDAMDQTLRHLERELDRELGEMSIRELERVIDRADFGIALAALIEGAARREASETAETLERIRERAIRYLDFGRLIFDVEPEEARIELEGSEVVPNRQEQLLPPGSYRYRIDAPGYQAESRTVRLRGDTRQAVSLALVPDVKATFQLDVPDCCRRQARSELGSYGFEIADDALLLLTITLDRTFLSEVAGERYYRLEGRVEVSRDGQVVASNTGSLGRVAASQIDGRSAALTTALTRAAIGGERAQGYLVD